MVQQILEGTLGLPNYQGFVEAIGAENADMADRMFKAMFYQYLKDKGSINTTYWSDKINNPAIMNIILMSLSKAGWIESHSIPARNWAEANLREEKLLQYVTPEDLESLRAHNKMKKYVLKANKPKRPNMTRINGKTKDTGLRRYGFMEAGNTTFTYNKEYMYDYKDVIQKNLTKSMDKIAKMYPEMRSDRATYDTISCDVLDYYLNSNEEYTIGENDNDSRGRAISESTAYIGNPINCKDFRSLLQLPQ